MGIRHKLYHLKQHLNINRALGGISFSSMRFMLILGALLFGVLSLFIADRLIGKMADEERRKMEIWAYATQAITTGDEGMTLQNLTRIIESNKTIPVIITTEDGRIMNHKNLSLPKIHADRYLYKKLQQFRNGYPPIIINTYPIQYLYYSDSSVLKQLLLFPYIQLGGFILILFIIILALISMQRSEQNSIWEGLSRETAHQLGTPISSLMAWNEYLRSMRVDPMITSEIDKDINRLTTIADRFQKVGGDVALSLEDIEVLIRQMIDYLSPRISQKVSISVENLEKSSIMVPLNPTLFGWVVENLVKNAVNAMKGEGEISIFIQRKDSYVIVDVKDTGCGIPRNRQVKIFRAGYTTRKRGWGIGLSLSKRIVEEYHHGHLFVKESVINKGTTFRISIPQIPIE